MNFTLQNIFRITNAYARKTFDTVDWNGRNVQDVIVTQGVPSEYMVQEEVEAFARGLIKILR
mgnify:CR=1 FL=1